VGNSNFLKDALYYASTEFKPHTVIDVATLTGYVLIVHTSRLEFIIDRAMDIALGEIYTGVFTVHHFIATRRHGID
jgi:aminopeptidase